MRYFKTENNQIFAYDESDDSQHPYMQDAIDKGYEEVTATWTPPEPLPPTPEQIKSMRQNAYLRESDPLFFKAQRGEATQQDWLDKVEEIKNRYPMPPI